MTFQEIFGPAQWVQAGQQYAAYDFRLAFEAKGICKAELTICGLGFFTAFLNGQPVSEDLFVPLDTNYHYREMTVNDHPFTEKMASRIICPRYDVTALLREGKNVLGVGVGPGAYNYAHTPAFGSLKLCFLLNLEKTDGTVQKVFSDEKMCWSPNEVVKSEFTRGEEIDYTQQPVGWLLPDDPAFAASAWQPAQKATVPPTEYCLQTSPADRIIRRITPRVLNKNAEVTVYDLGENIAGRPLVEALEPEKQQTIQVHFAEECTPEGFLDEKSVENLYHPYLIFHTDGRFRTMTFQYTWFAARYLEVSSNAKLTAFEEIHADVDLASTYHCESENLNWLYDAYLRTQLANMHMGIPSDCPHIERRGYTGDGQLTCETAMMLLDGEAFYRKWIDDISDCQDRMSGHVQYTAPYVPSGGGPGGWGCTIVEVPYVFYRIYGDEKPMRRLYSQMLHYFDYLEAHSENGLVVSDEPNCWCLGDWCTAQKIELPAPYINNYFYIKSMQRVLEIAEILGITADTSLLSARIASRRQATKAAYWDETTGSFCGGKQGADAFAVDLGMGDKRTFANLCSYYRALGEYDTGIFGTDVLTRVLLEHGEAELAYRLMAGDGEYSFGNWKKLGATTLWEYWTGERSHSHPMFGAVTRYLFTYILGIRQPQNCSAYRELMIQPEKICALHSAHGTLKTKAGCVEVSYSHDEKQLTIMIRLEKAVPAELRWNGSEYPLRQGENSFVLAF